MKPDGFRLDLFNKRGITVLTSSRRDFLKRAAVGAAGLSLAPVGRTKAAVASSLPPAAPFTLGIATYSLRELSRAGAIAAIKALGTSHASVKSFHLPYDATPEELAAGRKAFADAGVEIISGGVIYLHEEDEGHIRRHFEYAKQCGMPMMIIAPTRATLPLIEPMVQEYDIRVAIHNHGPEDEHFPGPSDALAVIGDMDPRIGLCVDVGHTARTGVDVPEALALSGERLFDVHMKDLRDLSDNSTQCIVGEGNMPVAAIFKQLAAMNYGGFVNLEYEIDAENPLPGMLRSMAYMRGVLAGLAA